MWQLSIQKHYFSPLNTFLPWIIVALKTSKKNSFRNTVFKIFQGSKLPELWSMVQWFCTNSVLTSFGITCPDGAQRFCLLSTLCCICLRLFGSRQVIFFCWLVPLISWLRYLYRCTLVQVSHWQYCGLLLAWNMKIWKIINRQDTGKSLSEALLFAEHGENMLCTKIVLNVRNNFCTRHVLPRFELRIFMYWTWNSMNNLFILWVSWCKNKSSWQRFTLLAMFIF